MHTQAVGGRERHSSHYCRSVSDKGGGKGFTHSMLQTRTRTYTHTLPTKLPQPLFVKLAAERAIDSSPDHQPEPVGSNT